MGRLGSVPKTNPAAAPHHRPPPPGDDPWLAHFSHPHHLQLTSLDQSLAPPICAGCNTRASGAAYSCKSCNYVLDLSCAKMPRRIRHPAHPHSLNILAARPPREGAPSNCAACGLGIAGFVFRCDPCGYELHCHCAAKPLSVNHRGHAHAVHLVFSPPYEEKVFSCDVCTSGGADHWLYSCPGCDFDVHIGCATAATVVQSAASQTPATRLQAPTRPPPPTLKLQASASSPVGQDQSQLRQRARPEAASQPVTGPQQPRTRRPLAPPPQTLGWPAAPQRVQHGPLRLQRPQPRPQSMRQRTRQQPLQQQQGNQGPDNGGGDQQNGEEDTVPDAAEGGGEGEDGSGDGNSIGDYSSYDGGYQGGTCWTQNQDGGDPESNWPNQDAGGEQESSWTPNEDAGGDYETNFMTSCSIEESDGSNLVMDDCSFGGSEECYAENSYEL